MISQPETSQPSPGCTSQSISLEEAIANLIQGEMLIYPTETYFAMGCMAANEKAVAKVFQIKRRLLAMPLPLIIGNAGQLEVVAQISALLENDLENLIKTFWPGSLTLILPARKNLSPLLTGGTGNVAVRHCPHPGALQLLQGIDGALVSTSANISGKIPACTVEEIDSELLGQVALFAAPPSPLGGKASTIVQVLGHKALRLLRPGKVSQEALREAGFTFLTPEAL